MISKQEQSSDTNDMKTTMSAQCDVLNSAIDETSLQSDAATADASLSFSVLSDASALNMNVSDELVSGNVEALHQVDRSMLQRQLSELRMENENFRYQEKEVCLNLN